MSDQFKIKPWTFEEAVAFLNTKKSLVRRPTNSSFVVQEHLRKMQPIGINAAYRYGDPKGNLGLVWKFKFSEEYYCIAETIAEDFVTEDGKPCGTVLGGAI